MDWLKTLAVIVASGLFLAVLKIWISKPKPAKPKLRSKKMSTCRACLGFGYRGNHQCHGCQGSGRVWR